MTGAALPLRARRLDLLRLPLIGRVLRWRYGRLVFQIPMLLVALLLVYDGFTGAQIASRNLATVGAWVHFRGVVLVALFLVGNLFCMACPFTLPRTLAKRLSVRGGRFPRVLRNKWIAIASLLALFFAYEWLDLWASPALTAWVIVAYFVSAFVLEAAFTESPFCKYVCPLGTFNFVHSTLSPFQIAARDTDVCRTCVGKECINGSYSAAPVILIDQIATDAQPEQTHTHDRTGTLGCGTLLFVPQMASNLDCVACLDCARACPHDNVGWLARTPGAELVRAGAWLPRLDVAFLAVSLTALGLLNAFGMIPPVYSLMQTLAQTLGLTALPDAVIEALLLGVLFVGGGLIAPFVVAFGAAWLTQTLTGRRTHTLTALVIAFAPAFVPLGAGVWVAHYGFHFLIGLFSIVPVVQQFLLDHGVGLLGAPNWTLGGISDPTFIGAFQTVAMLGGFAGSLWVAQRVAFRLFRRRAMPALLVWALVFLALMLAGLWIFAQPMEMRGTILFS